MGCWLNVNQSIFLIMDLFLWRSELRKLSFCSLFWLEVLKFLIFLITLAYFRILRLRNLLNVQNIYINLIVNKIVSHYISLNNFNSDQEKKDSPRRLSFSIVELCYFPTILMCLKAKQYMDDKLNLTSITVKLQVVCASVILF